MANNSMDVARWAIEGIPTYNFDVTAKKAQLDIRDLDAKSSYELNKDYLTEKFGQLPPFEEYEKLHAERVKPYYGAWKADNQIMEDVAMYIARDLPSQFDRTPLQNRSGAIEKEILSILPDRKYGDLDGISYNIGSNPYVPSMKELAENKQRYLATDNTWKEFDAHSIINGTFLKPTTNLSTGDVYYKEVPMGTANDTGMRSIFGSTPISRSFDVTRGIYNLIPDFVTAMGHLAEVGALLPQFWKDEKDIVGLKTARALQNFGSYFKADAEEDSFEGINAYKVANGIGQLAEQMLLAYVIGGLSLAGSIGTGAIMIALKTGGMAAFRQAAYKQLFKEGGMEAVEAVSKQVMKNSVRIGAGTGGVLAAGHWKENARAMGVNEKDAAFMYLGIAGITAGVESKFGLNHVFDFWGKDASKVTMQNVTKSLLTVAEKNGSKSIAQLFKENPKLAYHTALTEFKSGIMDYAKKASTSRIGAGAVAGLEEGTEEVVEGVLHGNLEIAYDYLAPFIYEGLGRQKVDLQTGNGLFGTSWKSITDGTWEEFAIGAIAGGFAGVVKGPAQARNEAYAGIARGIAQKGEIAIQEYKQELYEALDEVKKGKENWLSNLYMHGETPFTKGDGPLERADYNYKELSKIVDIAENVYNSSGLRELVESSKNVQSDFVRDNLLNLLENEVIPKAFIGASVAPIVDMQIKEIESNQTMPEAEKKERIAALQAKKADIAQNTAFGRYYYDPKTKESPLLNYAYNDLKVLDSKKEGLDVAAYQKFAGGNSMLGFWKMIGLEEAAHRENQRIEEHNAKIDQAIEEATPIIDEAIERLKSFQSKLGQQDFDGDLQAEFDTVSSNLNAILSKGVIAVEKQKEALNEIGSSMEEYGYLLDYGLIDTAESLESQKRKPVTASDMLISMSKEDSETEFTEKDFEIDSLLSNAIQALENPDPKIQERAAVVLSMIEPHLDMLDSFADASSKVWSEFNEKEQNNLKSHDIEGIRHTPYTEQQVLDIKAKNKQRREAINNIATQLKKNKIGVIIASIRQQRSDLFRRIDVLGKIFSSLGLSEQVAALATITLPKESVLTVDNLADLNRIEAQIQNFEQYLHDNNKIKEVESKYEEIKSALGLDNSFYGGYEYSKITPQEANSDSYWTKAKDYQDATSIKDTYFRNYFHSLVSISPRQFREAYNASFDGEAIERFPTYEQEQILKYVYAFMVNPDTSKTLSDLTQFYKQVYYARGLARTGKSTEIISRAVKMLKTKQPGLKALTIAPNTHLKEIHQAEIGKALNGNIIFTTNYKYAELSDNDIKDVGVVFIDEASIFGIEEVRLDTGTSPFKQFVDRFKNVPIVFLGDDTQVGARYADDGRATSSPEISRYVLKSPYLSFQHLTGNEDIFKVENAILKSIQKASTGIPLIKWPDTKFNLETVSGVRQFATADEVVQSFIKEYQEASEADKADFVLIAEAKPQPNMPGIVESLLGPAYEKIKNELLTAGIDPEKVLRPIEYHPDGTSAQGGRWKRVYVAFGQDINRDGDLNNSKALNTAVGRSKGMITLVGNGKSESGESRDIQKIAPELMARQHQDLKKMFEDRKVTLSLPEGSEKTTTSKLTKAEQELKSKLEEVKGNTQTPIEENDDYEIFGDKKKRVHSVMTKHNVFNRKSLTKKEPSVSFAIGNIPDAVAAAGINFTEDQIVNAIKTHVANPETIDGKKVVLKVSDENIKKLAGQLYKWINENQLFAPEHLISQAVFHGNYKGQEIAGRGDFASVANGLLSIVDIKTFGVKPGITTPYGATVDSWQEQVDIYEDLAKQMGLTNGAKKYILAIPVNRISETKSADGNTIEAEVEFLDFQFKTIEEFQSLKTNTPPVVNQTPQQSEQQINQPQTQAVPKGAGLTIKPNYVKGETGVFRINFEGGNKPYDGGDSAVIGSNERDTTEGLVAYLKNYKASRDKGIAALSSMTYYPRISADFKSNPNDRFSLHDVVKLMALRLANANENESLLEMRLSPDLEVTDLYLSAPGGLAKYKEDLLKNQVSVQGVRSVQIELKLNSNIGNLINIVDGYLSRSAISYQGKSKDFVEEYTAQTSHSEKFAVLKKYGFLTVGQLRGFVSSNFSEDELNEAKDFHNEDLKKVYEKLLSGPLAVPFMPFHSLTIKPYDKSEAERITYSEAESLITELKRHSMVMQKDGKNFPMLGSHISVPYKYDKEHFAVDISFFGEDKRVSIEVNGLPFAPDGDAKQGLSDLQKSIAELEKLPRNTYNDKLDLIKSLNISYIGNFIEQNRSFFAGATAFKSPFAKYNQALKSHYVEVVSKRGPKYFTFGVNQLPLTDKSVTGDMIIQALKKYVSDLEARLSMNIENDYLGNKLTVPFDISILGKQSFQVSKNSLSKMRIETSMIGMPIVHFNVSDLVGISKPATETIQSQPELDPFGDPNNIPFALELSKGFDNELPSVLDLIENQANRNAISNIIRRNQYKPSRKIKELSQVSDLIKEQYLKQAWDAAYAKWSEVKTEVDDTYETVATVDQLTQEFDYSMTAEEAAFLNSLGNVKVVSNKVASPAVFNSLFGSSSTTGNLEKRRFFTYVSDVLAVHYPNGRRFEHKSDLLQPDKDFVGDYSYQAAVAKVRMYFRGKARTKQSAYAVLQAYNKAYLENRFNPSEFMPAEYLESMHEYIKYYGQLVNKGTEENPNFTYDKKGLVTQIAYEGKFSELTPQQKDAYYDFIASQDSYLNAAISTLYPNYKFDKQSETERLNSLVSDLEEDEKGVIEFDAKNRFGAKYGSSKVAMTIQDNLRVEFMQLYTIPGNVPFNRSTAIPASMNSIKTFLVQSGKLGKVITENEFNSRFNEAKKDNYLPYSSDNRFYYAMYKELKSYGSSQKGQLISKLLQVYGLPYQVLGYNLDQLKTQINLRLSSGQQTLPYYWILNYSDIIMDVLVEKGMVKESARQEYLDTYMEAKRRYAGAQLNMFLSYAKSIDVSNVLSFEHTGTEFRMSSYMPGDIDTFKGNMVSRLGRHIRIGGNNKPYVIKSTAEDLKDYSLSKTDNGFALNYLDSPYVRITKTEKGYSYSFTENQQPIKFNKLQSLLNMGLHQSFYNNYVTATKNTNEQRQEASNELAEMLASMAITLMKYKSEMDIEENPADSSLAVYATSQKQLIDQVYSTFQIEKTTKTSYINEDGEEISEAAEVQIKGPEGFLKYIHKLAIVNASSWNISSISNTYNAEGQRQYPLQLGSYASNVLQSPLAFNSDMAYDQNVTNTNSSLFDNIPNNIISSGDLVVKNLGIDTGIKTEQKGVSYGSIKPKDALQRMVDVFMEGVASQDALQRFKIFSVPLGDSSMYRLYEVYFNLPSKKGSGRLFERRNKAITEEENGEKVTKVKPRYEITKAGWQFFKKSFDAFVNKAKEYETISDNKYAELGSFLVETQSSQEVIDLFKALTAIKSQSGIVFENGVEVDKSRRIDTEFFKSFIQMQLDFAGQSLGNKVALNNLLKAVQFKLREYHDYRIATYNGIKVMVPGNDYARTDGSLVMQILELESKINQLSDDNYYEKRELQKQKNLITKHLPVYNDYNTFEYDKLKNDESASIQKMKEIMLTEMLDFMYYLRQNASVNQKAYSDVTDEYGNIRFYERMYKDGNVEYKFNEVYEGMFYMYFATTSAMGEIEHGSIGGYKNLATAFKRIKNAASNGYQITTQSENPYNIPAKIKVLFSNDISVIENGEVVSKESNDGAVYIHPITQKAFQYSYGKVGDRPGTLKNGPVKPILYDVRQGLNLDIKSAMFTIGGWDIVSSSAANSYFERTTSPELVSFFKNKYQAYLQKEKDYVAADMALSDLYEHISKNNLWDQVVHMIIPPGASKSSSIGKVNFFMEAGAQDPTRYNYIAFNESQSLATEIDITELRLQQEASREAKPDHGSYFAQFNETLSGAPNNEGAKQISEYRAQMMQSLTNYLANLKDENELKDFIRRYTENGLKHSEIETLRAELLKNRENIMSLPQLNPTVRQNIATIINKMGIKPELFGKSYIQRPSTERRVYEYNGSKISLRGLNRLVAKGIISNSELLQIIDASNTLENIRYYKEFKITETGLEYGEISKPFDEYRIYGIEEGMDQSEVFGVIVNGVYVDLKNATPEQISTLLSPYFEADEQTKDEMERDNFLIRHIVRESQPESFASDVFNYLADLRKANTHFMIRTPSGPSSAGWYENVEWAWVNTNTVYVPPAKQKRDGTDFDYDMVGIYTWNPSVQDEFEPKLYPTTQKEHAANVRYYQNKILDELLGMFNIPANAKHFTSPVSVKAYEQYAESKGSLKHISLPYSPATIMKAMEEFHAGQNQVGIEANTQKGLGIMLLGQLNSENPTDLGDFVPAVQTFGADPAFGESVMMILQNRVNVATDNPTILALKSINLNEDTSPIQAAMIIDGVPVKRTEEDLERIRSRKRNAKIELARLQIAREIAVLQNRFDELPGIDQDIKNQMATLELSRNEFDAITFFNKPHIRQFFKQIGYRRTISYKGERIDPFVALSKKINSLSNSSFKTAAFVEEKRLSEEEIKEITDELMTEDEIDLINNTAYGMELIRAARYTDVINSIKASKDLSVLPSDINQDIREMMDRVQFYSGGENWYQFVQAKDNSGYGLELTAAGRKHFGTDDVNSSDVLKHIIGYLSKRRSDAYNQLKIVSVSERLSDFKILEEYMIKGEAFKRLAFLSGINQGLKVRNTELVAKSREIEFAIGKSIDSVVNGTPNTYDWTTKLERYDDEVRAIKLDYENQIRKQVNLEAYINSVPALKAQLSGFHLKAISEMEALPEYKAIYESIHTTVSQLMGVPFINYDANLYALESEINHAIKDLFYEHEYRYSENNSKLEWLDLTNRFLREVAGVNVYNYGQKGLSIDSYVKGRLAVIQVYELVKWLSTQRNENNPAYAYLFDNYLLKNISYDSDSINSYITVSNADTDDADILSPYRDAYKTLDKLYLNGFPIGRMLQQGLAHHHLISWGFQSKKTSLGNIIDQSLYNEVSDFMVKLHQKMKNIDPSDKLMEFGNSRQNVDGVMSRIAYQIGVRKDFGHFYKPKDNEDVEFFEAPELVKDKYGILAKSLVSENGVIKTRYVRSRNIYPIVGLRYTALPHEDLSAKTYDGSTVVMPGNITETIPATYGLSNNDFLTLVNSNSTVRVRYNTEFKSIGERGYMFVDGIKVYAVRQGSNVVDMTKEADQTVEAITFTAQEKDFLAKAYEKHQKSKESEIKCKT